MMRESLVLLQAFALVIFLGSSAGANMNFLGAIMEEDAVFWGRQLRGSSMSDDCPMDVPSPSPTPSPEFDDDCPISIFSSCNCKEETSLNITSNSEENELRSFLERARTSAAEFQPKSVTALSLNDFHNKVISSDAIEEGTAAHLDFLGREEAFALTAREDVFNAYGSVAIGAFAMTAFGLNDTNFHQFYFNELHPETNVSTDLAASADNVTNNFLQELSQEARDEWKKKICEIIDKIEGKNEAVIKAAEFLKKVLSDYDSLVKIVKLLQGIFEDSCLDKKDLTKIKELKNILEKMADNLAKDSDVADVLRKIKDVICELEKLLCGDLEKVKFKFEDGKITIMIDINDELEWRLLCEEVDTGTFYGKTNIYLDLSIKKDVTITISFNADPNKPGQGKIVFDPPDAVDLDLDSSGIFVVLVLECLTGIPDLDQFCLHSIEVKDGKLIIKGTSQGSKVCITITPKGTEVKVDGEVTVPLPGGEGGDDGGGGNKDKCCFQDPCEFEGTCSSFD